ncbi:MAG: AAA family ATPase [Chloracidobacterium sp.]|nr:AAA family ATPase [Chloracidobacterium sp.]
MSSTSANKKEIVDFLWDWGEAHGDWGKLLVGNIVTTEKPLTATTRQQVFELFLKSIGLHSGIVASVPSKPSYSPTTKRIELTSLSKVTGVNRLAKDQTISFSPNITVIYGENGTGKTGYGRILKALGISYDACNTIHPNIYESDDLQSAEIKFQVDGNDSLFTWDGSNSDSDLQNISVFNTNCVEISLSDRTLIVFPMGFHLFNLISTELGELDRLRALEIAKHSSTLGWVGSLTPGTPQHHFAVNLSSFSSEVNLSTVSGFGPDQVKELGKKEKELTDLNRPLLEHEIAQSKRCERELDEMFTKIKQIQSDLTLVNWESVLEIDGKLVGLEKKARLGIKDAAASKGIALYESTEFRQFINSAEAYIRLLGKAEYPNSKPGDICVYCQQTLGEEAKKLLADYRALLNDSTQGEIARLNESRRNIITKVENINPDNTLHQPCFGTDSEGKAIQPDALTTLNEQIAAARNLSLTTPTNSNAVFDVNYAECLSELSSQKSALESSRTIAEGKLANIEPKETQLKTAIAELKDRKLLAQNISEIKTAIQNKKIVKTLNDNSTAFNSRSISLKTSEAREHLVKENFDSVFQDELRRFRKSHIQVDVNFATERGKNTLSQNISSFDLKEILSDGEQRAIALAEFLTELQLETNTAPVVFDDPVNSIDHKIIDEVARRLVDLSKDRQVVILTHSVLLFNSFLYLSGIPEFKTVVKFRFLNTNNEYGVTGIVSDAEELSSAKTKITKINELCNAGSGSGMSEKDLAESCYSHLRSAIELCVEHEVLHGTVKRYQKNVALTQFAKLDGDKIKLHRDKLNELFERCCSFTEAHSKAEGIANDPSLAEFKVDFEEFKKIRDAFIK